MAAMVFPTSPTVGQTYTAGSNTWVWNGTTWDAVVQFASPTFTGTVTTNGPLLVNSGIIEKFATTSSVIASGATYNVDLSAGAVTYITGTQANNFTLNLRSSSTVTLMSTIPNGGSATATILFYTGATAVGPTVFSVDGTTVTPNFLNGFKSYGINCWNSISYTVLNVNGTATAFISIAKFAV